MINDMEMFRGKKTSGAGLDRDKRKHGGKREKLIKKLVHMGLGQSCALGGNGRTSPNIQFFAWLGDIQNTRYREVPSH